jgi:hypothetical protein
VNEDPYERRQALKATAVGLVVFLLGLGLGVFLSSCASTTTAQRVGQEQAVWIVWHDVYGRQDRPPLVRWVEGDALDCINPKNQRPGFTIVDADLTTGESPIRCRGGLTWSPFEVRIAWVGDEVSIAETTLAHEFLHAKLLRLGFWLENHHERPDFYPTVEAANAAVIQAGR